MPVLTRWDGKVAVFAGKEISSNQMSLGSSNYFKTYQGSRSAAVAITMNARFQWEKSSGTLIGPCCLSVAYYRVWVFSLGVCFDQDRQSKLAMQLSCVCVCVRLCVCMCACVCVRVRVLWWTEEWWRI